MICRVSLSLTGCSSGLGDYRFAALKLHVYVWGLGSIEIGIDLATVALGHSVAFARSQRGATTACT